MMMLKGLDDCGRTLTRLRIYFNRRKINIWIRVFISSLLLIFLFHKLNLSALKLIDESILVYYIGSAEGHEYPNLQVGDEVNPRPVFIFSWID